jgi:large conductance mechanosensitive channel
MIGDFINQLISFVIVAAAVYFAVVLPVNKLMSRFERPPAPTTMTCPECLSEIPIGAKRCAHCTSVIAA